VSIALWSIGPVSIEAAMELQGRGRTLSAAKSLALDSVAVSSEGAVQPFYE